MKSSPGSSLPHTYAAGSLLFSDEKVLEDAGSIQAVLGLYSEWPEKRRCTLKSEEFGIAVPCELDWDRELREPDELWLKVKNYPTKVPSTAAISIEVFGTCYEFLAELQWTSPPTSPAIAVTPMPHSLQLQRRRAYRRIKIEGEPLAPLQWSAPGVTTPIPLKLEEIGPTSLRVRSATYIEQERGILSIASDCFATRIAKRDRESLILHLDFENGKQSENFFEHYRKYVYPSLVRRSASWADAAAELYLRTGYADKFSFYDDVTSKVTQLKALWRLVGEGGGVSADYLALDPNGKPSGASSATLAFYKNDQPLWAFHQLCAVTEPTLLDLSEQLYCWRAEFLASRPEAIHAVGWFDSSSRWIERIYVKFACHWGNEEVLSPVMVFKRTYAQTTRPEIEAKSYSIGDARRYYVNHPRLLAGGAPPLLNASGALDAVIDLGLVADETELGRVGAALAQATGLSNLEVTVLRSKENLEKFKVPLEGKIDRFFLFPKEALSAFISSVEHSIAVTKAKQSRNGNSTA